MSRTGACQPYRHEACNTGQPSASRRCGGPSARARSAARRIRGRPRSQLVGTVSMERRWARAIVREAGREARIRRLGVKGFTAAEITSATGEVIYSTCHLPIPELAVHVDVETRAWIAVTIGPGKVDMRRAIASGRDDRLGRRGRVAEKRGGNRITGAGPGSARTDVHTERVRPVVVEAAGECGGRLRSSHGRAVAVAALDHVVGWCLALVARPT
jgi:hypothetical protein